MGRREGSWNFGLSPIVDRLYFWRPPLLYHRLQMYYMYRVPWARIYLYYANCQHTSRHPLTTILILTSIAIDTITIISIITSPF